MAHLDRPARICGHCDGFPTVAVTTGTRDDDGTRATLAAVCPACRGTGAKTAPARSLAVLGARAR